MGIRALVTVALLPVFIALGLFSAVIEYYIVKEEISWGLKEAGKSTAYGAAAFLDYHASDDDQAVRNQRLTLVRNLLKQSGVIRIEIIKADDEKMINESESNIVTTVPIYGKDGVISESLRVVTDATPLAYELTTLYSSLFLRTIAITFLALPVGWLLGSYLLRRINALDHRAREILCDPAPKVSAQERVRELDDVKETIEILAALLHERRIYSQKSVVPANAEKFPDNQPLRESVESGVQL